MADYETTLKNKQTELIRKSLEGSVFLDTDLSATSVITALTADSAGSPGTPELQALPGTYEDLGWLSTDGAQFSRDVSTSEVNSWGSVSPTRTDITADTTTMSVTAHETKLLTIGLGTGIDLSAVTPDATTGEFSVAKPARPKSRHYRVLSLAVDVSDGGEIYIARWLPRAKVTGFAEQAFGGGDDPITWGVTFTAEEDSDLGFTERWFFAGPGWQSLLADMGFGA